MSESSSKGGSFQGGSVEGLKLLSRFKSLSRKMAQSGLSKDEMSEYHELQSTLQGIVNKKSLSREANQRRNFRVDTQLAVSLKSQSDFKQVYLKNISGGGVYIECDPQPAMGQKLSFEIELEDKQIKMTFEGEVAWLNPKKIENLKPGVGLRFLNMNPQKQEFIDELVEEALGDQIKKKPSDKK